MRLPFIIASAADGDLAPFVPYLTIAAHAMPPAAASAVYQRLLPHPRVNDILALLRVDDFAAVAARFLKEISIDAPAASSPAAPLADADADALRGLLRLLHRQHVADPALNDPAHLETVANVLCVALHRARPQFPLQRTIAALLHLREPFAVPLLAALFLNCPSAWHSGVDALADTVSSDPVCVPVANALIRRLSDVAPQYFPRAIRDQLVAARALPSTVLHLTLHAVRDPLDFLSGCVNNSSTRSDWLMPSIRATMGPPLVQSLLGDPDLATDPVRVCQTLHLLCSLVGTDTVSLAAPDIQQCLALIAAIDSERPAVVGVCFLVVCPNLVKLCGKPPVLQCLEAVLAKNVCTSFLLLLSGLFHAMQIAAAVDMIRETLGLTVGIHSESLGRLADLFKDVLLPEASIASSMLSLPTEIGALSFPPIFCFCHLLKTKMLSRHRVDASRWVWTQLQDLREPLHRLAAPLVEEFVMSILYPPSPQGAGAAAAAAAAAGFRMSRFTDTEIRAVFASRDSSMATRLLVAYYVLFFNHMVRSSGLGGPSPLHSNSNSVDPTAPPSLAGSGAHDPSSGSPNNSSSFKPNGGGARSSTKQQQHPHQQQQQQQQMPDMHTKTYIVEYGLMDELPLQALLTYARRHRDTCEFVYAPLAALVAELAPEMLVPPQVTTGAGLLTQSVLADSLDGDSVTAITLMSSLANAAPRPSAALAALAQFQALSADKQLALAEPFVASIAPLLEAGVERRVLEAYRTAWFALYDSAPRRLPLLTVQQMVENSFLGSSSISHKTLAQDPAAVLRCDPRVFVTPPMLSIVLEMLRVYRVASRSFFFSHRKDNQAVQQVPALLLTQDSAIIHILLEACLADPVGRDVGDLQESRALICHWLHQAFIEDPLLIKLVHFQGYAVELVPITTSGIPSMHICLEFIPELLIQPHEEQVIFAMQLAGALVPKYPLPKSLGIARHVLARLQELADEAPATASVFPYPARALVSALPCLAGLAKGFPQLVEPILLFLQRLSPESKFGARKAVAEVVQETTARVVAP